MSQKHRHPEKLETSRQPETPVQPEQPRKRIGENESLN